MPSNCLRTERRLYKKQKFPIVSLIKSFHWITLHSYFFVRLIEWQDMQKIHKIRLPKSVCVFWGIVFLCLCFCINLHKIQNDVRCFNIFYFLISYNIILLIYKTYNPDIIIGKVCQENCHRCYSNPLLHLNSYWEPGDTNTVFNSIHCLFSFSIYSYN